MGPRIFGIQAQAASTIAVIRRGPSAWSHVSLWDPEHGRVELGSWMHGTLYPQRCDLSPDGRWLAYFALKGNARWEVGATYLAISRLPWLTALAAWSTCGTWTRGLHFTPEARRLDPGPPDVGDVGPLLRRYALVGTPAATFAVERRRGWHETSDSPPRSHLDAWDEHRAHLVTMARAHPRTPDLRLLVSGRHAAFRDGAPAWGSPRYALAADEQSELDGVQWAEWSREGHLLVATRAGALEVREAPFGTGDAVWRYDMAALTPNPVAPAADATRW